MNPDVEVVFNREQGVQSLVQIRRIHSRSTYSLYRIQSKAKVSGLYKNGHLTT